MSLKIIIKKSLVFFLAVCLKTALYSQDKTFTIVSNDLETGICKINVDPFNVLASQSRITFSGQVGAKFYKAGFLLNISGDFHYLDNMASASGRIFGTSIYAPQKSRNLNGLAGYLFTKTKNGPIKVHLYSAPGTGGKRTDTYAKVNIDYKKYFGIELGVKSGFSYLTYKGDASVKGEDYYSKMEKPIDGAFTTYMQYTWLAAGFSMGRIINAELNFSESGKRKASYMTRFYCHLLMPVKTQLEEIYYTPDPGSGTKLTYRYVLNNKVPVTKLGFRVGYEYTPIAKMVGFGLETGIMPGIQSGGNIYVSTKVSFNFGPVL